MDNNKFLTFKSRIMLEIGNLDKLENELKDMKLYPELKTNKVKGLPIDDIVIVRAIAGVVNDYYTCIERIFSVIARNIDNYMPTGESWHMELIEQMSNDIPGVRPYIVSGDNAEFLRDLRSFRHVFRGKYGFNLDINKLFNILNYLPKLSTSLRHDIELFLTKMAALYDLN